MNASHEKVGTRVDSAIVVGVNRARAAVILRSVDAKNQKTGIANWG